MRSFRTLAVAFTMLGYCLAQEEEAARFQAAFGKWADAAYEDATPSEKAEEAFTQLKTAWDEAPDRLKESKAYTYAQAAGRTAQLLAKANQHEKAAEVLSEMGSVTNSHAITPSRGKSETAFQDLATIHASVIAATGKDPLKGFSVGYELKRHEHGFSAVQRDLDFKRGSPQGVPVAIEDLDDSEATGTLLLLDDNGELVEVVPVAIDRSGNRPGPLLDRITSAYKLTSDGGPRRPVRAPIAEFLSKIGKVDSGGSRPSKMGGEINASDSTKSSVGAEDPIHQTPERAKWIGALVALALLAIAMRVLFSKRREH